MNEDEIKKIIDNSYLKILKREPDIDGLNYFTDFSESVKSPQKHIEGYC